jgi:hypothetical protein
VPTQACCLAHFTTQLAALDRGAPVDLLFQSVAGTQAANASFGVTLALLREGRERVREHHRKRDVPWVGDDVMYFATGPGPIRIVATIAPAIIVSVISLAWMFPAVRTGLPSWLDDANPARLTVAAIAAIAILSILGLASTTLSARLYAQRDL